MFAHVKRHCVGYLALFVSLGGTSLAIERTAAIRHPLPAPAPKSSCSQLTSSTPSQGSLPNDWMNQLLNVNATTVEELTELTGIHLEQDVISLKGGGLSSKQYGKILHKAIIAAVIKIEKNPGSGVSNALKKWLKDATGSFNAYKKCVGNVTVQNPTQAASLLNNPSSLQGAPGLGGFSGVISGFPGATSQGFQFVGAVSGASTDGSTTAQDQSTSPSVAVAMSHLAVTLTAPPGGTNGVTVAVEAQGVSQTLSCTIEAAQKTCTTPSSDSISVPANTPLLVEVAGQAVGATPFPAESIRFGYTESASG